VKLLLDIGNSRIKWAYSGGGELRHAGASEHRGQPAAAAARLLDELPVQPSAAVAVNVAGAAFAREITALLQQRWGIELALVAAAAACKRLRNGYTEPAQLGADRWAAIAGAWAAAVPAAADRVIVDAGTALTVDILRADGQHLGGLIVPGLALMRTALGQATSDLGRYAGPAAQSPAAPANGVGTSTRSAIEEGGLNALCGLIERVLKAHAQRSAAACLLLTGGDADRLHRRLAVAAEVRPLLVLEGLDYLTTDPD
jgi:type III pantothenate kinase